MLYRKIMAVWSEIHTKLLNTVCGQNVEWLNYKMVVHIVTSWFKVLYASYKIQSVNVV
jgi:hypothetical protein